MSLNANEEMIAGNADADGDYYRPPEGGRLYDMKFVSGNAFLRTYFVQKKLTANHAAAISHKN